MAVNQLRMTENNNDYTDYIFTNQKYNTLKSREGEFLAMLVAVFSRRVQTSKTVAEIMKPLHYITRYRQ